MVELGDKVKDKLTDLKGIVVAKAHYLYGCTQCSVLPTKIKDGVEGIWIDEPQLEVIKPKIKPGPKTKKTYGGIRNFPKSR
jgi:hypothetical protein